MSDDEPFNPRRDRTRTAKLPGDAGDQGATAEAPWGVDAAKRLLVGVLSGLGLLGFVVLVGGAIEWSRFDALGLPADQAVAAVPKQQLITVGAVSLVVFVLAGAAAVAVGYLVDRHGSIGWRTGGYMGALVLLGSIAAILAGLSALHVVILAVAGALLAALCLLVAWATGSRFLGFGVAVLLCVAFFGGVFAYLLNRERPQRQAVAVIGAGGKGLTGIFVARDDSHVWIGDRDPEGMTVLPCSDITAIAIGRVVSHDTATQARELLDALEAQRAQLASAGETPHGLC